MSEVVRRRLYKRPGYRPNRNLARLTGKYYRFVSRLGDRMQFPNSLMRVARIKGRRWIGRHVIHVGKFKGKTERWTQYNPSWAR